MDTSGLHIFVWLRRAIGGFFSLLARRLFGQSVAAVMGLTWKAAFRFRLFLVVSVLLLASVVALPLLIKDDGTARGFTQILLTYTLTTITALLGLSTLWLSCGTLARDIEECQIQVVAVKPVARWQIWLGKWLGLVSLNAALLALAGLCVYSLLQWRATRLPAGEQVVLRREVLVSRGSAHEPSLTSQIEQDTDQLLKQRLQKTPVGNFDVAEVRKQILEQVKAVYQVVPPGYTREWKIDVGAARKQGPDRPIQVRIKFNSADRSPSGTFTALWAAGAAPKTRIQRLEPMRLAPDTFHEFEVPSNLIDDAGMLTITFLNANDTALLFPLEDGLELLYREGGFALNFARGLGIIFCWMALLATIGLTAASFLSFPVAAFFSMGILTLALSSGTLANAVSEGTLSGYNAEKGTPEHTPVDTVVIPIFQGVLTVINLAKQFSPIDSLSSGRSISWGQLGLAFSQIVLLLGGAFAVVGVAAFSRRELATAQGTQ
jgi:ABC-type transport system involved in multi-copper enzyme maturation permease subunit